MTTPSTKRGIPDEIIKILRSHVYEYQGIRDSELRFMKRNNDKSQRVKSAYARWNRMRTIKSVRKLFLYLNRIKYSIFTYTEMTLWRTLSDRKKSLTDELQTILQRKKFTADNEKYAMICMTTIGKYDDKYGLFIACAMNRVFCYDVARLILMYI